MSIFSKCETSSDPQFALPILAISIIVVVLCDHIIVVIAIIAAMIEITAKLCRGPVYFTSEDVKCFVTLKNLANIEEDDSESAQGQHHG